MPLCFTESGMQFSFPEDTAFHIEKSDVYAQVYSYGVGSVECLFLWKNRTICLLEAKSTAPNPQNSKEKFSKFLASVANKYRHSMQLCYAMQCGIWPMEQAGEMLVACMMSAPKFLFLLIVKNHEKEWCNGLQESLRKVLRPEMKIWQAELIVLNEDMARAKRIVL